MVHAPYYWIYGPPYYLISFTWDPGTAGMMKDNHFIEIK